MRTSCPKPRTDSPSAPKIRIPSKQFHRSRKTPQKKNFKGERRNLQNKAAFQANREQESLLIPFIHTKKSQKLLCSENTRQTTQQTSRVFLFLQKRSIKGFKRSSFCLCNRTKPTDRRPFRNIVDSFIHALELL